MPPKAKITKDMIVEAAFAIAREEGAENINARAVAQKLGCSTQPVMYHFSKIEDLKKAVYAKADEYHSAYITDIGDSPDGPMKGIGLRYIQFAEEEGNLFRFLFQSNGFEKKSLLELIDGEELEPVLAIMAQATGTDPEAVKTIFLTIFLVAHGYASMFANNEMTYDEAVVSAHLDLAYRGAILAAQEERKWENCMRKMN